MESLFNKIAGFQACKFIEKRLQHWCFPVHIAKFLRTPILKSNLFAFGCLFTIIKKNYDLS